MVQEGGGPAFVWTTIRNGAIATFDFTQGNLLAHLRPPHRSINPTIDNAFTAYIDSLPEKGGCARHGVLKFLPSGPSSSNKCAKYGKFSLQSNSENAQLGSKLDFHDERSGDKAEKGGFYLCGHQLDRVQVYFKVDATDGRQDGCYPVDLWVVLYLRSL